MHLYYAHHGLVHRPPVSCLLRAVLCLPVVNICMRTLPLFLMTGMFRKLDGQRDLEMFAVSAVCLLKMSHMTNANTMR